MTIRRATLNDAEPIATCMLMAMEDVVYRFLGEESLHKAKEFLLHFAAREHNQYSYQNCWVAVEGEEVVGAANVYDGARLIPLRQPVLEYIRARFDQDFQPEDETQPGEFYLDCLGVRPNWQGQGVGTNLLQFLVKEYVIGEGQTLGLLVDEENPGARRLYGNLGFQSAGKRVLFGHLMEHLQIKPG